MRSSALLLTLLLPTVAYAEPRGAPVQGFRAGVSVPVAMGDQRGLTPALGFGADVRLDSASRRYPWGAALLCSYDEFILQLPDREVELSDGSTILIAEAQSLSYASFLGAGTLRASLGPFTARAESGAGVVVGFFHGPAQAADPEVFSKALMPAVFAGAGLALHIREQWVVDLTFRYRHLLFNDETVQRNNAQLRVFNDTVHFGVTAGYFF
jgi:hypothetical protein